LRNIHCFVSTLYLFLPDNQPTIASFIFVPKGAVRSYNWRVLLHLAWASWRSMRSEGDRMVEAMDNIHYYVDVFSAFNIAGYYRFDSKVLANYMVTVN
jgi:hypothetical protein